VFQGIIAGGKLTDYGADPWGALRPFGFLVVVFSPFYWLALRRENKRAGIWRVRPKDRLIKEENERDRELVSYNSLPSAILIALYFSLLSAFHFGWRDLNVANWIVRIQRREYLLRATEWVRSLAGIQSLVGLYLVALFLLSYFGTPFA